MSIYCLKSAKTETDWESIRRNPIEMDDLPRLPVVECPQCGLWLGADYIPVKCPAEAKDYFMKEHCLSPQEWESMIGEWSRLLDTPAETLKPGATFGELSGVLKRSCGFFDILFVGGVARWVNDRVKELMTLANVTGIEFLPVKIRWGRSIKSESNPPRLWQLYVTGTAKPKEITKASPCVCSICKRTKFLNSGNDPIVVDLNTWDGSDIFSWEKGSSPILLVERVRELLMNSDISGYSLELKPAE